MNYSPQITPGIQPLSSAPTAPFSLYSNKQIVSSSQPIRDQVERTKVMAGELERQISDWEVKQANSPFRNLMSV